MKIFEKEVRLMPSTGSSSTPRTRDKAQARVRALTRGVIIAATAFTALIGVVVAREHPGASSTSRDGANSAGASQGSSGSSKTSTTTHTGDSGSSDITGSTAAGSTTTTTAPSASSSKPVVTSGGTSR